jgi:hypothetical protein
LIHLLLSGRQGFVRAVHLELEAVFHEKTVRYYTVSKYLHFMSFGERDVVQGNSCDIPDADLVERALFQALAFHPFASVGKISCMILLSNRRYTGISSNPLD